MFRVEPNQVVRTKVVATAGHGLHLDYEGIEVLVHAVDCPWGREISPKDYARVGDELDVKILRVVDEGRAAAGWLPWPHEAKTSGSPRRAV